MPETVAAASDHGVLRETALTAPQWEKQLKRQRSLEENAVALGGVRFRQRVLAAQAGGEGSTVGAARKLMMSALEPAERGMQALLDEVEGKKGRRHVAVKWVKMVGVDAAAYITVKIILDHIHERVTLYKLSTLIAERIIDELRYRRFKEKAPGLFDYKMESFMTSNYAHRSRSLSATMRYAEVDCSDLDMPMSQRELLGTKLIDIVAHCTGLVEMQRDTTLSFSRGKARRKDELKIVAADIGTLEYLNRRNEKLEFLNPLNMPMVVPPLAWGPGEQGGYRYALRPKASFVRGASKEQAAKMLQANMAPVYEAVNRVQETAYRINRPVLELINKIEDRGGSLTPKKERAGIPRMEKYPEPPKLATQWASDEERKQDPEFKAWRKAASRVHDMNFLRAMQAREFLRVVEVAEEVVDEGAIWFPHNVDFRGRIYPITDALSPQGDDLQKSLLQFAEGVPLGPDGAAYLAIHGANALGTLPFDPVVVDGEEITKVSKLTLQERVDWIEAHTHEIVAITRDPFGNRWWMNPEEVDEPLGFYAFALEWAGYYEMYRQGRGEEYVSHLPVAADGTCNGLQHYSALWLDPVCGAAVNVVPAARPQDVYMQTADEVERRVTELADAGDEMAQLWVSSGLIGRKLVKRNVMTFPYGSKVFGFRKQLIEHLQGLKNWRSVKNHFRLLDEEGNLKDAVGPACSFMARQVWESLDEVVESAKLGMKWMQDVAREIAREGKPVSWVVPQTGFPVVQPYYRREKRQIKTVLMGQVIQPVHYEDTGDIEMHKQANAIAPNVIHSLDAAALQLTVINCSREEEGMQFAMVHDSYGTHAGRAGFLGRVTRESFIQLYGEQNVAEDLRDQWVLQSAATEDVRCPPMGPLDLAAVIDADFFFC